MHWHWQSSADSWAGALPSLEGLVLPRLKLNRCCCCGWHETTAIIKQTETRNWINVVGEDVILVTLIYFRVVAIAVYLVFVDKLDKTIQLCEWEDILLTLYRNGFVPCMKGLASTCSQPVCGEIRVITIEIGRVKFYIVMCFAYLPLSFNDGSSQTLDYLRWEPDQPY